MNDSPSLEETQSPGLWKRFVAFVRLALSNHDHDFTRGSLWRAVLLLAVPMVLEPLMESLFAVADIYFVGELGAEAVAAVGLTEGLVVFVYTLGFGLGIPATAMVARAIGEKRPERAAKAAVQANLIGLAAASLFGLFGVVYAEELLGLMGATPGVIAQGKTYAQCMLGSAPLITLLFVNASVFRGSGDAVVALKALWIANALNIVLDPLFIFGLGPIPGMGLTGAAIATIVGRFVGLLLMVRWLLAGTSRLKLSVRDIRFDPDAARELLKLSVGGIGQLLVETTSWVFLVRIVSTFGPTAVAGYTIAIRLFLFCLMPAWGLSGAAATLVGQNLGAGQPDRAERALWIIGLMNMVYLGFVTLAYMTLDETLASIFTNEDAVEEGAAVGLRVIAVGGIFYGWGMVLVQSFNGAGDTRTPLVLNLVCFWLVKLPVAYWLSQHTEAFAGPYGVFAAVAAAYSLNALLAFLWFRGGRWKRHAEPSASAPA